MAKTLDVFDVQDLLRDHAERGLDLAHPHGIFLHGRLYPASVKRFHRIDDYHDRPSDFKPFTRAEVDIPLESGNVIKVRSSIHPRIENVPPATKAILQVPRSYYSYNSYFYGLHSYVPLDFLKHTSGAKGPMGNEYDVELTKDNAHEVLAKFNKEPFQGQSVMIRPDLSTARVQMSPEEFTRHAKAFASVPHHLGTADEIREWDEDGETAYSSANQTAYLKKKPGDIVVSDYSSKGFSGGKPGEDTQHHVYDPHTEQLHRL